MTFEHRSEKHLEDLLRRALTDRGFTVQGAHFGSHQEPDLDVSFEGRRFVIETRAAGRNRADVLHGLMAAAMIQARRYSSCMDDAVPLPVVAVSNLSDRAVSTVAEFMSREAPESAWGLLDRSGRLHLRGVPGIKSERVTRQRSQPRAPTQHELDPFTDLGQWMAKVLVAAQLPATLISAPRAKLSRARHLAFAADVSEPTAARWTKLMRNQSFLDDTGRLRIVRAREFFERWRRAVGAVPRREVPVRFSLPIGAPDAQLCLALSKYPHALEFKPDPNSSHEGCTTIEWKGVPRACLALFEATAALGRGHVLGAPVHFYLESVTEENLRRFGLERAGPDTAQLRVIEPTWPESVFRAAVRVQTRHGLFVPACDIVQTWLDISDHPVRGREQAAEIERDVLTKWVFTEPSDGSRP